MNCEGGGDSRIKAEAHGQIEDSNSARRWQIWVQQSAEKIVYFVIPSEARNLSFFARA
jgi:hypothetical protein